MVHSAKHALHLIMAVLLLSACMELPERDNGAAEDEPVLWLYEADSDELTATLYRKAAGQSAKKIANHVIPGSHKVLGGSMLFLDDHSRLYYASTDQEPYPLFEHVQPYSYGFLDDGRRVFAVTDDNRLILKTFGADERIMEDHAVHVVPLRDRLLVMTDEQQVYAYDYYGNKIPLSERASSLHALNDGAHAVIVTQDRAAVTDGVELILNIESEALGPVHVSRDGRSVLYLDQYEASSGTGVLMLRELHAADAVKLAEQVELFAWDDGNRIVWYVSGGILSRYEEETTAADIIAEGVRQIAYSRDIGMAAVVTGRGELTLYDRNGQEVAWQHAVDPVQRVEMYGSGVLYTTVDGMTEYAGPDGKEALGVLDTWTQGGMEVIGMQQNTVLAFDESFHANTLLDNARQYRFIYYGEKLIAERLLLLSDAVGTWRSADGVTLVVKPMGRMKGTLAIGEEDPTPFYIGYAAHDHLMLTLAGKPDQPVYLYVRDDDTLVLTSGEEMKEYLRVDE